LEYLKNQVLDEEKKIFKKDGILSSKSLKNEYLFKRNCISFRSRKITYVSYCFTNFCNNCNVYKCWFNENFSKILGHKSLRTTKHYAKVLDKKVSEDMMVSKNKFTDIKLNSKIS